MFSAVYWGQSSRRRPFCFLSLSCRKLSLRYINTEACEVLFFPNVVTAIFGVLEIAAATCLHHGRACSVESGQAWVGGQLWFFTLFLFNQLLVWPVADVSVYQLLNSPMSTVSVYRLLNSPMSTVSVYQLLNSPMSTVSVYQLLIPSLATVSVYQLLITSVISICVYQPLISPQ